MAVSVPWEEQLYPLWTWQEATWAVPWCVSLLCLYKGRVPWQGRTELSDWCLGLGWKPCWKAPCGQAGLLSTSCWDRGTGRLETLSQTACVLLPSACAHPPPSSGWFPDRWQTCSQVRGLANLWAVLAAGPKGQAQTLPAGQKADARLWPGRGDTFSDLYIVTMYTDGRIQIFAAWGWGQSVMWLCDSQGLELWML